MQRGEGLRITRVHDGGGRLSPEILTNLNRGVRAYQENSVGRRGAAMINMATALLFILAIGLYAVSLSAQFRYVMAVKHDDPVSWIEAVALDAGMAIFSLLALGLARAGQAARAERLLIIACAVGSAVMNLAAADSRSLRSVLAFVMPPLFLAVVADRVVAVVRRHYLGDDGASAWAQLGRACLYGLRFVLAPPSTARGIRASILRSAPVPELARTAVPAHPPGTAAAAASPDARPRAITARPAGGRGPAAAVTAAPRIRPKTDELIRLVVERHGPLEKLPIEQTSRIATAISKEIGMHQGSARTALRKRVLASQNGRDEGVSA